jgi:hypothetical protein
MNDEDDSESANRGASCPAAAASEALLRAEIGFWREMLGKADGCLPPESIERMRHALALAEYRLLRLDREFRGNNGSTVGPLPTSPVREKFIH